MKIFTQVGTVDRVEYEILIGKIIGLKPSINPLNNPSPGAAFSPTSEASGATMHSNNPVYGGEDEANQYPFAGTWNKVRGFLEENIRLFQEKLKIIPFLKYNITGGIPNREWNLI